jgi:hypothetical protein
MWAHLNFPNHQIVYVDAGSQFAQGDLRESELRADLIQAFYTEGLAWAYPNHREYEWTKRDLLDHLKLPGYLAQIEQVQSGFIALSPLWDRMNLIRPWREIALFEEGRLFTDAFSRENPPNFREHRHDQSALSCLWKMIDLPIVFDKSYPSINNTYPLLAYRNNSSLRMDAPKIQRNIYNFFSLAKDFLLSRK